MSLLWFHLILLVNHLNTDFKNFFLLFATQGNVIKPESNTVLINVSSQEIERRLEAKLKINQEAK